MVNMQMSAEEAKEYASCGEAVAADAPRYPYGLCVSLDDDSLAKLGITDLPKVGAKMTLTARVVVTSIGSSERQGGDAESRMELQITDMELDGGATGAQRQYPGMNP